MKMKQGVILGAVMVLATAQLAFGDTTALNLIQKGNDYVGKPSRNKVLEIFSDKSVASTEPNIWHVVYYDPTVISKSVEVKFGAGEEMNVSHPVRPFELPASEHDILDHSKLNVDSDRALTIATSQPLVKSIELKASRMMLENSYAGPVWNVQLYASKAHDSTKLANIGLVRISADDGSVIKSDLNPSHAE
jgi:hypothetical protein